VGSVTARGLGPGIRVMPGCRAPIPSKYKQLIGAVSYRKPSIELQPAVNSRLQFNGRSLGWKGPKREAVNAAYGVQDNQWLDRIITGRRFMTSRSPIYLNSRAARGPVEGKNRKYGTARGASGQGRWDDRNKYFVDLTELVPDWGSSPPGWVSVLQVSIRSGMA